MKLQLLSARILCTAAILGSLSLAPSAVAATLSLESVTQYTSAMGTPVDLTAEGSLDWAYWDETNTTLTNPVAPTNEKLGGSLISSASAFGPDGGALRGTTQSVTAGRYSFSDGTTLGSDTNHEMAGLLFNNKLGTSALGDGFTLQITGDPGAERYVNLYFGGFAATGELKLTLAGVTTVVDASQTFAVGTPKAISVYTVRFQPDSIGDLLTVTFTAIPTVNPEADPTVNSSAHVGLEAVTVSNIPEPGSALLLGIGAIALAGTRRRRA